MHRTLVSAYLAGVLSAPAAAETDLADRLQARIADSGAEVSVAMRTLDGREEILIAPDQVFHAASTMKIPVMIELFRQASAGELALSDALPVVNEFRSIVDGSPYGLSIADDSHDALYRRIGERVPLRDLCEAMITVSSNLATNLLIERLGVERIRDTVAALGADGMRVLRGVEDTKAYEAGQNNTTTARALLVMLEALARGEVVTPAASQSMIDVLLRQQWNEAIPAGLPEGTPVAHKTGNITAIHHDAAIVLGARPYVLVVLVRGIEDIPTSAALISALARDVHAAVGAVAVP